MFKSSVFKGTVAGVLFRKGLGYTSTGDPIFGALGKFRFTPITSKTQSEETSIRTDKSGSKSRADEGVAYFRIQIEPSKIGKSIKIGDRVDLLGASYKVASITPVFNIMDAIADHILADLKLWV